MLSRFWTRIWAFLIDAILLGILGSIILYAGMPFFLKIGGWGRLIGWPIALAYYSIGNSALAGGQTPGKRLMRIEVVDATGAPVSFAVALKRALIFTGPYILLGVPFFIDFPVVSGVFQWVLGVLNFGILLYYIFNRETRQSLHDLAAGTFVVKVMRNEYDPLEMPARTKWPFYVWMGTSVVLFLALIPMGVFGEKIPVLKNLMLVQQGVAGVKGVRAVSTVSYKTTHASIESGSGISGYYVIGAEVTTPLNTKAPGAEAEQIFKDIVQQFSDVRFEKNENETLNIVLVSSADIGIAHVTKSVVQSHTIKRWEKMVNK